MDQIMELLLANFTTILLVIGIGIIAVTSNGFDRNTNRCFVSFVLLVLVLLLADILDFYLTDLPQPTVLRHITSSIGYTLRPASMVIMINLLLRRSKANLMLWIPVAFVGIVAFSSYYSHFMFWFNEQNFFMRGPLWFISHLISAVYLVTLIVLTIKKHRNITHSEFFVVMYIAAGCVIATVIESLLSGYKFLLTGAMITSCALYYIVLYSETYRCDPLTGLKNRRSFYLDAQRMQYKKFVIVSIDLNGLKDINDSHGHSAGDKALQSVGAAMTGKNMKRFSAYRIGGDEFAALGKEQSEKAAGEYIERMRTSLEADGLTASFGCALYSPGDNFDDICIQADTKMYDDKKRYKHRTSLRE